MDRMISRRRILITAVCCLFFYTKTSVVIIAANIVNTDLIVMKEEIKGNLSKTVHYLAEEIGPRSYTQTEALQKTTDYIKSELSAYGYEVSVQAYRAKERSFENIYVVKRGNIAPDKILVIGAHYDTVPGTPGADDNASGVAGLLELARVFADEEPGNTLHFVAFALEEPPFFRTKQMGSYVYAKKLNDEQRDVEGMICLESMGFFRDGPDSQMFPLPFFRFFYPTTGNYITFVSDFQSKGLLKRAENAFRQDSSLPVESLSSFALIPGIDFSDHRSFWKFGYAAIMVTDTAFYRNPHYHGIGDVPSTLDYERLAEVVIGLTASIRALAGK
jgi:Zn-dependent M28 family amino/carboxypeptidase